VRGVGRVGGRVVAAHPGFGGDTLRQLDQTAESTRDEIAGSASDLALLLWHRTGTDTPAARAWFTLASPR
jgi:hypothetical protein